MIMNLINAHSQLLTLIGVGVVIVIFIYLARIVVKYTFKIILIGILLVLGFVAVKYVDNKTEIDSNISTVIEKGNDIKDKVKETATRTSIVSTKILKVLK